MIKLVGFKESSGMFTPENSESPINYDNRVLVCLTDEGLSHFQYGWSALECKVKTLHLAKCFGTNIGNVSNCLSDLIDSPIEFLYAPENGKITCIGIKPV